MPSFRSLALGAGAVALVAVPDLAVAQTYGVGPRPPLGTRLATRFGVSLVVYLLLGGALVAFGPEYAEKTVSEIRAEPGEAFGWGLLVGLVVPLGLAVLAVTIIGLVVAIPGFILLFFVSIVGNAVTVVWVGTLLGDERPDGKAVGLGAISLAVVSTVPLLGSFLTSIVGFFGLGVVGRGLYESYRGDDDAPRRSEPPTTVERAPEDL